MSDLLKSVIQDLINERSEQASVTIHQYLVQQVKSALGEAKQSNSTDINGVEWYDWAQKLMTDAGVKMPGGPDMADTGDGYWVSASKARTIIDNLKAAGYVIRGSADYKTASVKGSPKKGLSFDFDDPEEKNKVGLRFFDETHSE